MKKLMILGGSRYALPVIKSAHELGLYVITADYLPENIAHRYSDEYCNVNIIDKEATLKEARLRNIDGIMSFACDPGVVTAAYVAEQLGLPSVGSFEAVSILQNKGKFRTFLKAHGFNVPTAKGYSNAEDALKDVGLFQWPVIVKPTDSAGSKGVTFTGGNGGGVKVEPIGFFVIKDGNCRMISVAPPPLTTMDRIVEMVPGWPSSMTSEHQAELASEIQRLIKLLGLGSSIYNIETRECVDGKAYIMECSPRGGGNRLAECLHYATGVDLIRAAVLAAIGETVTGIEQRPYNGSWAEIIIHSDRPGIFQNLWISEAIRDCVIERDLWVKAGDHVGGFSAANEAIGTLILRFDSPEQLETVMANQKEYIRVVVQ